MSKSAVDNCEEEDNHSINVSIYKPDGLFSLWNWFTRKNKNGEPTYGVKNVYKFKVTKNDLKNCKKTGIDISKLQNCNSSYMKTVRRQGNVYVVPKTELDSDFWKNVKQGAHKSVFTNHKVSQSTISVKSKRSKTNLNFVRTVETEKSVLNSFSRSKASFKVGIKSKTNIKSHMTPAQTNIFLKSVPTAVLKTNTQKKLLVFGKTKPFKGSMLPKSSVSCNDLQKNLLEGSEVPMLLTKMKSMEQQLCDIENKIVSRKTVLKTSKPVTQTRAKNIASKGVKSVTGLASHEIYSKSVQSKRKSKLSSKMKSSRNKATVLIERNCITSAATKANTQNNKEGESLCDHRLMSKPTFEWKHTSWPKLHDFGPKLLNDSRLESNKVEKAMQPPLGILAMRKLSTDEFQLLYEILKSCMPKQAVVGLQGTIDHSNNSTLIENVIKENKDSNIEDNLMKSKTVVDVFENKTNNSAFDVPQQGQKMSLTKSCHQQTANITVEEEYRDKNFVGIHSGPLEGSVFPNTLVNPPATENAVESNECIPTFVEGLGAVCRSSIQGTAAEFSNHQDEQPNQKSAVSLVLLGSVGL